MNLLKTSVLSAIQTAAKILAGFAVVKMVAFSSGPAGLAQLGQFQNIVAIITIISGGMFYTGVTKLVAEHGRSSEQFLAIVSTVLKASVVCSIVVAAVVFFSRDYVSHQILNDRSFEAFVPFLPFFTFLAVLNGLWLAILNGLRRIRELVLINIVTSALMVILSLVCIPRFGQIGAFCAILLPPAIVVITMLSTQLRNKSCGSFDIFGWNKSPRYVAQLSRFAFIGLVSALVAPLAQIAMRDYLATRLSVEEAGIWQGITRISEVYLVFITSSLSVYFLPKLAQVTNADSLIELTVRVLRLVVPVSLLLGSLIYIFRDILIWLLFTPEFNSMRDFFPWQIVGDMIKIISWVFSYIILARGSATLFVVGELIFSTTYLVLGMLMVPIFGLEGAVFAYGLNYLFYFFYVLFVVVLMVKRTGPANV